jgi:hypothetical protein
MGAVRVCRIRATMRQHVLQPREAHHTCRSVRTSSVPGQHRAARLCVVAKAKVPGAAAAAGGDKGNGGAERNGGWKGDAGKVWRKLNEVAWDDPARDWNKFLNVKTAGTIVDADLDNETITATPVKCSPTRPDPSLCR